MTVAEQIQLTREDAFFRPIMVKALNKACEQILSGFQDEANRTKKIDDKLYSYALNFSRQCSVSNSIFNSCIANLLDDAEYKSPQDLPDEVMADLYAIILADYQASFIRGGASNYPSWIERIAGYELGDEDLKTV